MVGYNTTVLNVCTALYPSLGGILAHFGWRWPFLLPLMALPVLYVALKTPLANPSLAPDPVSGTGAFARYLGEVRSIARSRRIVGLLAITGVTFVVLYGPLITGFPVFADSAFGASPAAIGAAMAFASVGAALTASQLGRLYGAFSPRTLLLGSQVLYAASLAALANMPALLPALGPIFLFGVGQGLNIPNVQAQLLSAASAAQRASVMAVNGMLLRVGQSLAPVGFSFIMVEAGIAWGFYAGIALAGIIAALTLAFMPRRSRRR
jgi:predicted MFS family arabinose efflux permease